MFEIKLIVDTTEYKNVADLKTIKCQNVYVGKLF